MKRREEIQLRKWERWIKLGDNKGNILIQQY